MLNSNGFKQFKVRELEREFFNVGYSQKSLEEIKRQSGNDIDKYIENLEQEKSYWAE